MKFKKEETLYMVKEQGSDGLWFWNTYDSLKGAQLCHPENSIIYVANLKAVGKTQSVLVEIKRNELAK